MAAGVLDHVACNHGDRKFCRVAAIEHQAYAGLLIHRPCRLCDGCRHVPFRSRHRRRNVLSGQLLPDERWRICGRHLDGA